MKGLLLLFIAVAGLLIGWGYAPTEVKASTVAVIRKNLIAILLAFLAVATVAFFSLNSIVRLV